MHNSHWSRHTHTLRLMAGLLILVSLVLLARPPAARAADYVVTNTADSGVGTLREAIESAMLTPDDDIITFDIPDTDEDCVGANDCTIYLVTPLPAITAAGGELTIDATDAQDITIEGGNALRPLVVERDATLTLKNLTITDSKSDGDGGAIHNSGTLTVIEGIFINNEAVNGGAIYNAADPTAVNDEWTVTLSVLNSTFQFNTATGQGGAIANSATAQNTGSIAIANLTLTDRTLFSNNTAGEGGAIANIANGNDRWSKGATANLTITDGEFNENTADDNGGAIYSFATTLDSRSLATTNLTIADTSFSNSAADAGDGGALYANRNVTVTNGNFYSNKAESGIGGAIALSSGTLDVTGSGFTFNESGESGGAIHGDGVLRVTGSEFTNNHSSSNGGAILLEGSMTVTRSTFLTNTADVYGGAFFTLGEMTVVDSDFSDNTASWGGGIATYVATLDVFNSTFFDNTAYTGGGAIDNDSSTTNVTNSTFSGNTGSYGGAISHYGGGSLDVNHNTFYDNTATSGDVFYNESEHTVTNSLFVANGAAPCAGVTLDDTNITDAACSNATVMTGEAIKLDTVLSDNGGPTRTHALLAGSAAIDFVTTDYPATDQRGIERPQGANADAGAYEMAICGASPFVVGNDAELTEAIHCINALSLGEQHIDVANDFNIYNLDDSDALGTPVLLYTGSTVFINGGNNVLTGDDKGRIFTFGEFSGNRPDVVMDEITLTGGWANEGGAILDISSTLTIFNSTFSNNRGYDGGAIQSHADYLRVSRSTFSGNSVANDGGAIAGYGMLDVTNVTFSNNSAMDGGAIAHFEGRLTVNNSTFFRNHSASGYAVFSSGDNSVMLNSLLIENGAQSCSGFIAGSTNISDVACDASVIMTVDEVKLDPVLADNGGPTKTHALLAGSEAIDHTVFGFADHDQRGIRRPQGISIDSGSYEYLACGSSPYSAGSDAELDHAIRCINEGPSGPQQINITGDFAVHTAGADDLGTPELTYYGGEDGVVTIDGGGHTLTGSNARFFTLGADAKMALNDITLSGGRADTGGAILNHGVLTVTDSAFDDNKSVEVGGAIYNDGGRVDILESTFTANHSDLRGGALGNYFGNLYSEFNTFNGNTAGESGGAISTFNGYLSVYGSDFTANKAGAGGAIFSQSLGDGESLMDVIRSAFTDNEALEGGAIANSSTLGGILRMTVAVSSFTGGSTDNGGAIAIVGKTFGTAQVTVRESAFDDNAADNGGAIYSLAEETLPFFETSVELDVINTTFSGNTAGLGGALYTKAANLGIESTATTNAINNTFYGNAAGGAVYSTATDSGVATVNLTNNLLVGNTGGDTCVADSAGATIVAGVSNITDDDSCDSATVTTDAIDDILDTTLADNGGPTKTHALVEGSIAVDFAHIVEEVVQGNDQRGEDRPQRNGFDAGAFELGPPDDPCPPVDGNVITNFCFEDGSAPWTFHSDGHGVYNVSPFEPFAGNGAAEIKITVPGSNVQFYQSGIALQGDTEYELTFAAKSKDGRDLSVFVHKHGANYASYGLSNHVFNLTDEWDEYTVTFKTPVFSGGSVNDARLRFWLAPFDAAGAVYSIDRVVLRPAGGDPLPEPPPPPDPEVPPQGECTATPGNLIANPGYEDGTFGWLFFTNGSANFTAPEEPAADPYECDANARVKINTSGNNVQLFQTGIELEPNTHYRLRLAAKATGANAVQLFVQRHSAPHSNYGLNGLKLDLTRDWQVFVVDFTTSGFAATTTDTRLRFWLAPYDTAGAVFEFDDVVLTPVDNTPVRATDGAATRARATTADAYLVSGYFIDNNHTDRLGGGYVGVLDGCRNARASVSRLWPANNKLWPVSIGNIGTPQSVQITGVWQDEPVGFEPDAVIGSGGALHLRAERDLDAGADGRVYTIQFRATYADGQSCNGIVTVGVPLSNRRGVEARSGGELFTSTDK